jgi:hypothetical protein
MFKAILRFLKTPVDNAAFDWLGDIEGRHE